MSDICPNTSYWQKEPRFQAFKEYYADRHFNDHHLLVALQLFKDRNGDKYSDDWLPETSAEKGIFTRFLNHELKRAQLAQTTATMDRDDISEMYSTLYTLYTPEQLDSRIDMLASDFRDELDAIQEADTRNRTRQQLIQDQADGKKNGFVKIMERVFDYYEKRYPSVEQMMANYDRRNPDATPEQREAARKRAEYTFGEYQTVLANKERLSALAAIKIGEDEGFVVNVRNFEVDFEDDLDLDEPIDNNEEGEDTDKQESSKGDRYADFRTLKLMQTLGPRARRLLSRIKKTDSNGKWIKDDLGVGKWISPRQAAVVVTRAVVNSTPESLMDDLRASADMNPWVNELIKELEADSRKKTTIFCNFKKAATVYVYTNLEDGAYTPHIANSRSQGHALMREAGTNLQAGYVLDESTSIYVGYGSLKSAAQLKALREKFNKVKDVVINGTKNIRMVEGDKKPKHPIHDYESLEPVDAMQEFLRLHPDVTTEIANQLRGLGFSVNKKDIDNVAIQTMTDKGYGFIAGWGNVKNLVGRNKLYRLVTWVDNALARAEQIAEDGKTSTGQYFYNTASDELRHINNCISLAKYDDVEARVNNDGKSMSTFNNVNLLHQVFDVLANTDHLSEEEYQARLEREYLRYEGMAIGKGENQIPVGWLKYLKDGKFRQTDIRKAMRVIDVAAFNHVEYARLTREQKLTNSLIQFFGASRMFSRGTEPFASYEFPIQSDYSTAYNFIYAPRLKVGQLLDESTGEYGYQSELVDALADEVFCELDRIASIEERVMNDPNGNNRPVLSVYEREGMKFQIFPEFNTDGFRQEVTSILDNEDARKYVKQRVVEQLQKIRQMDIKTIEDSGMLKNPNLRSYGFFSKDGKFDTLSAKKQEELEDWFFNTFYARLQMTKLWDGGVHHFNGLIDFEKRNMLTHAPHSSLYTNAVWNGEKVGKESQNVVYVEDEVSQSAFLDDIMGMLKDLLDEKLISPIQYKQMKKAYSKIKSTDGQGFRTLESYRSVMVMTDLWTDRQETAYQNIIHGHPQKGDIDTFMQNIKPVATGFEHIEAAQGERQKPVKLTFLHKYSEVVLLPVALSKYCLASQSVPLRSLDMAQSELKKQGKEVDMFLFHSGAKVGAHSIIRPFERDKDGNHILKDDQSIKNYITNTVQSKSWYIHEIPFKYYGIAASTTPHDIEDRIARASQKEKTVWANIQDGDIVTVNGKKISAKEARQKYYEIKTANIIDAYKEVSRIFSDSDELERIFQEELASKPYQSREMKYALSHLKNGTFALPLFSPNIEHQVQQLLASIIKKRLTKIKTKGANVLVSTAVGMEMDVSPYEGGFPESYKLGVAFEGTGKNKHVKWYDAGFPLPDSLREFANSDGEITPEMLQELVDNGTIPEEALMGDASRTPSDAEHSTVPYRIKWFSSKLEGGSAKFAKEAMVTTGQDFDGDKLRVDLPEYDIVWDEEKLNEDYDKISGLNTDTGVVKAVLGQNEEALRGFNTWRKWATSYANPDRMKYRKVKMVEYDESKSPLENSARARHNMMMKLTFAQLTSPTGSRRQLIPGGCEESKIYAKSLHLVRLSRQESNKQLMYEAMTRDRKNGGLGMSGDSARKALRNTNALYEVLKNMDDSDLTTLVRSVSSAEMPYTLTHSADAFDYLMGGAEMIGIYALYNSAQQMMQRLDMHYVPMQTKYGPVEISLFGKKIDKLFSVKNMKGNLASLGLARLLNAAVDNGKDPILGYLNQTKEMAEITSFLFAAGIDEEEVHLIMNQPAVIELINRLKGRDASSLKNEAKELSDILQEQFKEKKLPFMGKKTGAVQVVGEMTEEEYINALPITFQEVVNSEDVDLINQQTAILEVLAHLSDAAGNLADFTRLTRPESDSGAIGSTIADITQKVIGLNEFRNKLAKNSDDKLRISGMREILKPRSVDAGMDSEYLMSLMGNDLEEVVTLNSLMMDSSLDMFKQFFPQARADWINTLSKITDMYHVGKKKKITITEHVAQEMILWKLLSNKKFINGNPQEEQKRIIVDVPKQVKDLKERIEKAKQHPGTDSAAEALIGNVFLEKLTATSPENSRTNPRLIFSMNGPAVEGQADAIRAYWGDMLNNEEKGIRDLAIDLFKYNMYNSGFGYGMYEFAHFAPFSVLLNTPGYIEALQDILRDGWVDGSADEENFINQYIMNHWGDNKFLPKVSPAMIPNSVRNKLGWEPLTKDSTFPIEDYRYIVLEQNLGEGKSKQTLYRVVKEPDGINLIEAKKLGVRLRGGQATLQYNPSMEYWLVEPVVPGNDSSWGTLDAPEESAWAQSNNSGDPMSEEDWIAYSNSFGGLPSPAQVLGGPSQTSGFGGLPSPAAVYGAPQIGGFPKPQQVEQTQKLEEKAQSAVKQNGNVMQQRAKIPTSSDTINIWFGSNENADLSNLAIRPFQFEAEEPYNNGEETVPITIGDATFQSVEHAFQYLKVTLGAKEEYRGDHYTRKPDWETAQKIFNAKTGAEARSLGRSAKNVDSAKWDSMSSSIMKDLIKASFQQNPDALRRLLATGDATFTHIQDKSKWGKEFPRILTEVRSELRSEQETPIPSAYEGADMSSLFGTNPALQEAMLGISNDDEEPVGGQMFSIARRDKDGNPITVKVQSSPEGIREARRQQVYVELNDRLREILREKGVDIGVLTDIETRMGLAGVADFDTATVTAEGLVEMIRIAEGYRGEEALPEEFAHLAIEMIGHDNPLVKRLLTTLDGSEDSLREAFEGQYDDYVEAYKDDREKMILEAAGKLVAKNLFMQQEIQSSPVRRLVHRVVDAIKSFFRQFRRDEVQNAIFDANQVASKLAREMLGGKILDDRTLQDINAQGQLLAQAKKIKKDLTGKSDILNKLLKTETKRLFIFQQRIGYDKDRAKKSSAIIATEKQIAKLEAAIRNYKTEDAIVTYMKDSLDFLEETRKALENAVNGGQSVNRVCKRLNLVRDTLYSFSKVMEDVRQAIVDGEVQDSVMLTNSINETAGALEKFFRYYNTIAMRYFEEMLTNVYGEHGVTVDIGKDKGRNITIKEMARRADRDISMASRWFHSIADCNDYVLKAIDDVTRNAKYAARRHASQIKPRIEAAMNELMKETGSRDQSFMFEMKHYDGGEWCNGKQDDGKLHKTGRYISAEQAQKLSPAKKKFYNTMMDIKKEADKYIPETLLQDRKIVMLRKYVWDRVKESDGIKSKAVEVWEGVRNAILDTSDSIDFDNYEVRVDFEGNRVDMLPVNYLAKGKGESYDDMVDDVATSIMAYAGMAFEYGELNNVIGVLENAKYMASQRDVTQKTGNRTQRESIETEDVIYREPFSKKQARTNIENALDDFFQMHIYGHIQRNEGTIGNTRISKRKAVDFLNRITSYSQMAINIPQRIANISTGVTQIMLETVGKHHFSAKDTAWASALYMTQSADRLAETGKTDYDNKLSLWLDKFDVHQDNGREYKTTKYKKSRASRVFNSSLLYAGLTMGEDYLASTTALAVARNFKMKDASGKESNLWDAYEVKYTNPTNKTGAYLALKPGYKKADGSELTFDDEKKFAKAVAGLNFELQGIYNLDDRSAIQQYALGALLIMYRKWIAPALKRRYAGVQYNALKGEYNEGYHRTAFRVARDMVMDAKNQVTEEEGTKALWNIIEDMKALRTSILMNWSKLTPYEKSNVKRSAAELATVVGLYLACALLGKVPPQDDDDRGKILTWWDNQVLVNMLRLRTEIGSMAPTPMLVDEALHILKSPFAAIGPLQNTINAFELLIPSNYMVEIKSGRYRGHKKAYKYFRELPIISMFKKVDNFIDPSPLINYYKNDAQY